MLIRAKINRTVLVIEPAQYKNFELVQRACDELETLDGSLVIELTRITDEVEALHYMVDNTPSLVVWDLNSHSKEGMNCVWRLHCEMKKFLPTIVLSTSEMSQRDCKGYENCHSRERSRLSYCDANMFFIRKPLDEEYLKILIKKSLQ